MKYGVLVHCLYDHSHWTIPRTQPDGDAKVRGKHHLAVGHLRLMGIGVQRTGTCPTGLYVVSTRGNKSFLCLLDRVESGLTVLVTTALMALFVV